VPTSVVCLCVQKRTHALVPKRHKLLRWLRAALCSRVKMAEITLRFVDLDESQTLNTQYRGKAYPTNILSFNLRDTETDPEHLWGDLVLCSPIVIQEAQQQHKSIEAHYAHLCVHGMLHLQGFDHIDDDARLPMEALEIRILARMGYANPYLCHT